MKRDDSAQLTVDLGIAEDDRARIVDGLSHLLADAFTLYLKTHNFHWNVTGPQFRTLHLMFEEQYTEQWTAIDEIAERIRALGARAPGTYEEFAALTSVEKSAAQPEASGMVEELAHGQAVVVRTARELFKVAEAANDQPTCDMLTQRMQVHEKNAWMLRSLLEG